MGLIITWITGSLGGFHQFKTDSDCVDFHCLKVISGPQNILWIRQSRTGLWTVLLMSSESLENKILKMYLVK